MKLLIIISFINCALSFCCLPALVPPRAVTAFVTWREKEKKKGYKTDDLCCTGRVGGGGGGR